MSRPRRLRYPVSPLECVVLIHNTVSCADAENDAELTVEELIKEMDTLDGMLSETILQRGLYNCNMNSEDGKFWHPYKWSFDRFVTELLPKRLKFDKYYHWIVEDENGLDAKTPGR